MQPHQHSHLASWGICTILRRWGLEPTNKQPSDVYTWSTTLPLEMQRETHLHRQWEESEVVASAIWWFHLYLGEDENITESEQKQNTWLKQNMVNMLLRSIFEAQLNKPASQLKLPSKKLKRSPHGCRLSNKNTGIPSCGRPLQSKHFRGCCNLICRLKSSFIVRINSHLCNDWSSLVV